MSFHKIAPVKKTRKPGAKWAAAQKPVAKAKPEARRRPVGNKAGEGLLTTAIEAGPVMYRGPASAVFPSAERELGS